MEENLCLQEPCRTEEIVTKRRAVKIEFYLAVLSNKIGSLSKSLQKYWSRWQLKKQESFGCDEQVEWFVEESKPSRRGKENIWVREDCQENAGDIQKIDGLTNYHKMYHHSCYWGFYGSFYSPSLSYFASTG